MAIAGVRVMRVRVVFMPIVLLRRCRSGDGERQRRRRDRGHGQKKSAKLHGATSFNSCALPMRVPQTSKVRTLPIGLSRSCGAQGATRAAIAAAQLRMTETFQHGRCGLGGGPWALCRQRASGVGPCLL